MESKEQNLTGYPSIDKPWLKYYSEQAKVNTMPELSIYETIKLRNKNNSNLTAIRYFGRNITFSEMFQKIDKYAGLLVSSGVRKGDIITLCLANMPEVVYLVYAANKIGAIADIEFLSLSQEDLVKSINETHSKVLALVNVKKELGYGIKNKCSSLQKIINISPFDSMGTLRKTAYRLRNGENVFKSSKVSDIIHSEICLPVAGDDVAVILHTGGTTGVPKGVELTNNNFNSVAWHYENTGFSFKTGDVLLHCIPPFHAFGFSVGIHTPLYMGVCVDLCILPDDNFVAKQFIKDKPNHFVSGPSQMKKVMSAIKDENLPYLKTFAMGGAPVSITDEEEFNKFLYSHNSSARAVIGYGMSELCATACTASNEVTRLGSVGIPFPGVNVKIINTETQEMCSYNETGEIWISSPGTMKSYYNNKYETDKVVIIEDDIRWLKTGDLGLMDDDGFLYITGRIKRLFATRDKNDNQLYKVYPTHMEKIIDSVSGVNECAVVSKPDSEHLKTPVAFVVSNNENTEYKQIQNEIFSLCEKELPQYAQPSKIMFVDELPLTPIGKVDYRKLESTLLSQSI